MQGNLNTSDAKNDYAMKYQFNVNDYLDCKLKPGETTKTKRIRLLPIEQGSSLFRVNLMVHSLKVDKEIAASGFKKFTCLSDPKNKRFSESVKCPLCQKSEELLAEARKYPKDSAQNKTLWNEAKLYMPSKVDILRCIDRDDEEYGPKFCRFGNYGYTNKNGEQVDGKGVFEKLQKIYHLRNNKAKEKGLPGYNIFDLYEGRDIYLTISVDKNGKTSYEVDIDEDKSPLSTDNSKIEKWINDPKKWYDVYSCKSHDYLEVIADGKVPEWSQLLKRYVDRDKKDELETAFQNGNGIQMQQTVFNAKPDISSDLPF